MKKILVFLLSLTIAYLPALTFASTAEDMTIYDKALREKNKIGVSNVRVKDNVVYADFKTKVNVDGSNVTVKQPIQMPASIANSAKYLASISKEMAKGTAYSLAITGAVTGILKGVDYVMDPKNNTIIKKVDPDNNNQACGTCSAFSDYYYVNNFTQYGYYSSISSASIGFFNAYIADRYNSNPKVIIQNSSDPTYVYVRIEYTRSWEGTRQTYYEIVVRKNKNSNYLEGSGNVPVNNGELEDAMGDWLRNNPTRLTDPVVTELYTPYSPLGSGFDGTSGVHFPSTEYTPEIIANMLEHRNAELEAEKKRLQDPDNNPSANPETKPEISNPNKTETDKEPNLNPETEIINHPDGSKTEIRKDKKVDPETGEIIVTTTTTKTDAEGNKSTETSIKREPAPKTEETKLPDVCDYFAFLCEWTNWTKEKPDTDKDEEVEVEEDDLDLSVFSKDRFKISRECPAPIEHSISLSGITTSFSFSLTPICDVLNLARPALIAGSYLYAAYIVIGASRNG